MDTRHLPRSIRRQRHVCIRDRSNSLTLCADDTSSPGCHRSGLCRQAAGGGGEREKPVTQTDPGQQTDRQVVGKQLTKLAVTPKSRPSKNPPTAVAQPRQGHTESVLVTEWPVRDYVNKQFQKHVSTLRPILFPIFLGLLWVKKVRLRVALRFLHGHEHLLTTWAAADKNSKEFRYFLIVCHYSEDFATHPTVIQYKNQSNLIYDSFASDQESVSGHNIILHKIHGRQNMSDILNCLQFLEESEELINPNILQTLTKPSARPQGLPKTQSRLEMYLGDKKQHLRLSLNKVYEDISFRQCFIIQLLLNSQSIGSDRPPTKQFNCIKYTKNCLEATILISRHQYSIDLTYDTGKFYLIQLKDKSDSLTRWAMNVVHRAAGCRSPTAEHLQNLLKLQLYISDFTKLCTKYTLSCEGCRYNYAKEGSVKYLAYNSASGKSFNLAMHLSENKHKIFILDQIGPFKVRIIMDKTHK